MRGLTYSIDHTQLTDDQFLARARSSCHHKAAYINRCEAKAALNRRGQTGKPYKCPFCGHWHCHTQNSAFDRMFKRRLKRILRETPMNASDSR